MLRIEIDIPRPILTLMLVVAAGLVLFLATRYELVAKTEADVTGVPFTQTGEIDEAGGPDRDEAFKALSAEETMKRLRVKEQLLERQQEILLFQLKSLEDEKRFFKESDAEGLSRQISESRRRLSRLLHDRTKAEADIVATLQQIWESQGSLRTGTPTQPIVLSWPVRPEYGISATFRDEAYKNFFGIDHEAIDIPVLQGTEVGAAADGIIEKVADNGQGYSYVIVRHDGFATLYGHVSEILVEEGQAVSAGESIALSGGRPGSKGAGALTTGPHLHLEVIVEGKRVDPEKYLPEKN